MFGATYEHNSNGYTHVFGVQELNGDNPNTIRCNRKSEIQDGGRQTGSTFISASIPDSNEIPTATPMFSGSRNSMVITRLPPYVTGSRKFKMVAVKLEVLLYQLLYQIATKFQRLLLCFRGPGFPTSGYIGW